MERDNCSRGVHPYGFDDAYGKVGKANKLALGKKTNKHKKKHTTIASMTTFCLHSGREMPD